MSNAPHGENRDDVVIKLDRNEALFLITVLKSSTAILTALLTLQETLPELPPPPINENGIATISVLAQNIERQLDPTPGTDAPSA